MAQALGQVGGTVATRVGVRKKMINKKVPGSMSGPTSQNFKSLVLPKITLFNLILKQIAKCFADARSGK
jgi:hypothetical protein